MKWWLISDEDVKQIGDVLKSELGKWNLPERKVELKKAILALALRCHETDAIPSDYQEKEIEQID